MKSFRMARHRSHRKRYASMGASSASASAVGCGASGIVAMTCATRCAKVAARTRGGRTSAGTFCTEPASLRLYFLTAVARAATRSAASSIACASAGVSNASSSLNRTRSSISLCGHMSSHAPTSDSVVPAGGGASSAVVLTSGGGGDGPRKASICGPPNLSGDGASDGVRPKRRARIAVRAASSSSVFPAGGRTGDTGGLRAPLRGGFSSDDDDARR
mmetsp:Transcript_22758/g.90253  ORF Transcript_22758/g.90253 Transcript_22758/m.90253 type:complete len:217 (+) Transcript_22758:400-1050(+)